MGCLQSGANSEHNGGHSQKKGGKLLPIVRSVAQSGSVWEGGKVERSRSGSAALWNRCRSLAPPACPPVEEQRPYTTHSGAQFTLLGYTTSPVFRLCSFLGLSHGSGEAPPTFLVLKHLNYSRRCSGQHAHTRLFYGCSHRVYLSGDDSRDRHIKRS